MYFRRYTHAFRRATHQPARTTKCRFARSRVWNFPAGPNVCRHGWGRRDSCRPSSACAAHRIRKSRSVRRPVRPACETGRETVVSRRRASKTAIAIPSSDALLTRLRLRGRAGARSHSGPGRGGQQTRQKRRGMRSPSWHLSSVPGQALRLSLYTCTVCCVRQALCNYTNQHRAPVVAQRQPSRFCRCRRFAGPQARPIRLCAATGGSLHLPLTPRLACMRGPTGQGSRPEHQREAETRVQADEAAGLYGR